MTRGRLIFTSIGNSGEFTPCDGAGRRRGASLEKFDIAISKMLTNRASKLAALHEQIGFRRNCLMKS